FPEKAIEIALRQPEERSEEDIRFVRSMMKELRSFRRYTNHMQLMLARVIRYERFGRRRVVVRKGHRGNSFYFVFSGQIAVTQDEDGSSAFVDPEPILLRKGVSFGEVALLKGLRRNATIVCMEETELLVVDREDFFNNKLDQELRKEFEYRFNFFRSLELFSSWPDTSLETLADHCKTEEFNHSQVIVEDTSKTRNIIFVTKGRCDVLRLVDLSQCPSYHKWIKQQEMVLGKPIINHAATRPAEERFLNPVLKNYNEPTSQYSFLRPSSSDTIYNDQGSAFSFLCRNFHHIEELVHKKWYNKLSIQHSMAELPRNLIAAVYLRVDMLRQGHYFALKWMLNPEIKDSRGMAVISQGSEVIRLKLDKFCELADICTVKKLQRESPPFPSDDELCQIFLEQNRWKIFKGALL
uniref:Cyclic nucleotide-binding domain-containing protein 2 n=1 Tax=Latimeria chalumnae TaxID=7897 RepID=H3AL69_LATCH